MGFNVTLDRGYRDSLLVGRYLLNGLSPRSWSILTEVGGAVKLAGLPFASSEFFNLPPTELGGSSLPWALDASMLAPTVSTCANSSESEER
eukprot:5067755-Pyramimonas_sp.AAC.1